MKYRLIDRENGDVVYEGDSIDELKCAFKAYNNETEDDWFPGLCVNGKVVSDFANYCW